MPRTTSLNSIETTLHFAAKINDTDGVRLAILGGANPNACEEDGITAMHIAAEKRFLNVAEIIVSTSKKKKLDLNLDAESRFGETPLLIATKSNSFDMVEFLLKNGADPNINVQYGRSPIQIAILAGFVNITILLISYNADVNTVDSFNHTPLSNALFSYHSFVMIKHLLRAGADPNYYLGKAVPLLLYAVQGTTRIYELRNITLLIRGGADIHARDLVNGDNVLHCAAKKQFEPVIELLMKEGADLYAKNKYDQTPYQTALKFRNNFMAQYLADVERKLEEAELRLLDMRLFRSYENIDI